MELNIVLANNSNREKETKKQLKMLFKKYDLSKWVFQKFVQISEGEIPHSHPVLTLNTFHLNNDIPLLSQFLHEQMHWFVSSRLKSEIDAALEELKLIFPQVLERDKYHLIINYLEYDTLKQLIGGNKAKEIIDNKEKYMEKKYTDLYKIIIQQEDKIREILDKNNLLI
jgi:hypothetical protein